MKVLDPQEGGPCPEGCGGRIKFAYEGDGCCCHINPPCGYCTSSYFTCDSCGWEDPKIEEMNDHVMKVDRKTNVIKSSELRPLREGQLDWHSFSHTHFTMQKIGVYPIGMTREEVEGKVRGTFGGRFNSFANGKFEYISYTD